jgi:hypothetical protein
LIINHLTLFIGQSNALRLCLKTFAPLNEPP